MKKKRIPSDGEAVRSQQIARVIRRRQFACAGCGRVVVSDGTPGTKAFIWTNEKTKARKKYCYACDDELIQGVR